MRPTFVLIAFLAASAAAASAARIVLSEALADPAAAPDAQGEFLELANAGDAPVRADTLFIESDGDTLAIPGGTLAPGAFLLLCRDTTRAANGGLRCDRLLKGLSLPNGRPVKVAVTAGGSRAEFLVPASRPGVSWENTFEDGFSRFLPAAAAAAGGDSATPGFRNSRSVRPARHDLALEALAAEASGAITARVRSAGTERPARPLILVAADGDWDGLPDAAPDTLAGEWSGAEAELRVPAPGEGSLLLASVGRDENPANDGARLLHRGRGALEITEICPAPEAGPEWVEIRNATGEAGGPARALSLAQAALDGAPLAAAGRLAPGAYLILTEDAAAFRARYPLKVEVCEPPGWAPLRNTGDTVRLAVGGFPVDALGYGGRDAEGGCLARGDGPLAARASAGPTPGFAEAAETRLSWAPSGRVLGPGRALEIEVRVPPRESYVLRVFDLEGNCVKELGRGGPGRHAHQWLGEGKAGRLPPGPYLLCLSPGKGRPRKHAVVLEP